MADLVSGDIEVQHSGDPSGKCGGWITFPFIIAILADSFFGDIPVILASTFIYLLGISLLTLIAFSDYLRPRPCEPGSILCQSPSDLQLGILYVVLALVTTGTAGTRVALASAGANQYEKPKDQGTFFNCYFLMVNTGAIISATEIVYTQENASWKLGFVKRKAVISSKNEDYYHHGLGQKNKNSAVVPSKSFRFFNRATLKTEGESGDTTNNKWRLCSVQEVEDFKAVLRLLPLWLSIIFVSIPIAVQSRLMVLQALVTDRVFSPHFKVSAGSIQVIAIIFSCIFIIMNNWLFYPMYHKLTNKVMTPLQKIGMGHVFTILSMAISAVVESKRLKTVQNEHLMSVLWLFPPFVILGISEAFQLPAHIELFYGEFPESLRNKATSLTSLVIGITF
ncbi:hypothetical protein YC2023_041557 [Brassica napus]